MLNSAGNLRQFKFLQAQTDKRLVKLSSAAVKKLTATSLLSISEKIEILELNLGFRFLTEANTSIEYTEAEKELSHPTPESVQRLVAFLETELGLLTSISSKESQRTKRVATQVNIFANQAIKNYFAEFETEITDLEIGILYGYHPKAILAFGGYISKLEKTEIRLAYQYYNSKVYPADFYDEVDTYEKAKWEILKQNYPEIIEVAENEFAAQSVA